jgi:endonuclease-3
MANQTKKRRRALEVNRRLALEFPGEAQALCALSFTTPFQLLCATILSAQCTDVRVNAVVPNLFEKYPTPDLLAQAMQEDVEEIVRSTGFYHSKAKHLIEMAQQLISNYGGEVPTAREDLITLSGVGRKTANVVRSVAFDLPGLPVDTHVGRLSRRLGLTIQKDPVKVEKELGEELPADEWGGFSLRLILHGRAVCDARKPRCSECDLADLCPKIGVT